MYPYITAEEAGETSRGQCIAYLTGVIIHGPTMLKQNMTPTSYLDGDKPFSIVVLAIANTFQGKTPTAGESLAVKPESHESWSCRS